MDEVINRVARALQFAEAAGAMSNGVYLRPDDARELLRLARKALDRIKDQSHGE